MLARANAAGKTGPRRMLGWGWAASQNPDRAIHKPILKNQNQTKSKTKQRTTQGG